MAVLSVAFLDPFGYEWNNGNLKGEIKLSISKNTPLGVSAQYDANTNSTVLSWSYLESADIEYFEIEYYDPDLRKWVPFDGRNGVVKKK
jgi:hypothetical protein